MLNYHIIFSYLFSLCAVYYWMSLKCVHMLDVCLYKYACESMFSLCIVVQSAVGGSERNLKTTVHYLIVFIYNRVIVFH